MSPKPNRVNPAPAESSHAKKQNIPFQFLPSELWQFQTEHLIQRQTEPAVRVKQTLCIS